MTARTRRILGLLPRSVLALLVWIGSGCNLYPPQPAYLQPQVGTVYQFEGFTNTVVAVDGMRTFYQDDQGRLGSRLALFIQEDPRWPVEATEEDLAKIWPLRMGGEDSIMVHRGEERSAWIFRVTGIARTTVPAGEFETWVVQAAERPILVRSPELTSAATHVWWYAPSIGTVVRVRSTYLTGPSAGRTFESELVRMELPAPAGDTTAVPDTLTAPGG